MPELASDWKLSWGRAMCERNAAQFALLVTKAETAMFRRYQEIADSPAYSEERIQMASALDDLAAVKAKRLNWRPARVNLP